MGEDNWNPILAQTHVKSVPFWQVLLAELVGVLLIVTCVFCVAAVILSLERPS